MEILKEEAIPAVEAKNSLQKRDKDSLTYEQKIALDFLKKNVKINVTDARKMFNELLEVGRVKPHQAAMVVNILPKTKDDVKLIFAKERLVLNDEEINRILEIVKKYD
ncbi:MAG: DNA-directed RNA polymerase subunit F [Candidatus Aenigmatarchaeota archaeon]|nr:MAG: DNA-directed RNA polymerase subunit F [Candidatus Aenigmarchaeota archaeon]